MYFYRDQNGVECDLIIEHANDLSLVEAKAAATATSDLLRPVRRVRDVLERAKPCYAIVAYGGAQRQKRTDADLLPWSQLHVRNWI